MIPDGVWVALAITVLLYITIAAGCLPYRPFAEGSDEVPLPRLRQGVDNTRWIVSRYDGRHEDCTSADELPGRSPGISQTSGTV